MKKIKITGRTETMFAQAVALTQNGKMKSAIYGGKEGIFIKNMDSTILMRFGASQDISDSFSFFANDYESNVFGTENGKIIFVSHYKGYEKKKECAVPKDTYEDIKKVWDDHFSDTYKSIKIMIPVSVVSLLDEGLSHIEIHKAPGKNIKMVQKDIYSGSKIEIQESKSMTNLLEDDAVGFETIGLRTVDFMSLFTFSQNLIFYVQQNSWVYFTDSDNLFSGILATCLYDEIGYVAKTKEE